MINSGERIGQYLIQGTLGSGGMAVVYRALDEVTGRIVALKCIEKTSESQDVVNRFKREVLLLAKLKHPNIVEVFEFVEISDLICFAMELVEGDSLESLFFRKRTRGELHPKMDEKLLFPVLVDICRAMAVAHSSGIFHRDIKPANVLVEAATSRAVLLDFGLARGGGAETLTKTGAVLGTLNYLAPEQIKAGEICGCTDVYQWGLMAHHLLSGHLPFEQEDDVTAAIMRTSNDVPSVLTVAPHISPNLAIIIDKSIKRLPQERYGDGIELLSALIPNGPPSELSFPFRPSQASMSALNFGQFKSRGDKSPEDQDTEIIDSSKLSKKGKLSRDSKPYRARNSNPQRNGLLISEKRADDLKPTASIPSSKDYLRKVIVGFIWLTILGCVVFSLLFSGKITGSVPASKDVSLSRLQPELNKIILESTSSGLPGIEELSLSFSTVLPARVELCFVKLQGEPAELLRTNQPVPDDVDVGVASTLSTSVLGCRHKLKFKSSFLQNPLFLRFVLEDGQIFHGPPLGVKDLLSASFKTFATLLPPLLNKPEDYFELIEGRFKEIYSNEIARTDRKAYANEVLSKELRGKYLEIGREYERVGPLVPWFLEQKGIEDSYKKQVAIISSVYRYLPNYCLDEGFNIGDVSLVDGSALYSCTINRPFSFSVMATLIFGKEIKLYHRKKILDFSRVILSVKNSNSDDSDIHKCTLGKDNFENIVAHRPRNALVTVPQYKVKSVKISFDDFSRARLLEYDFIALELNLESCDNGCFPIVFIDDIPLLYYLPDADILDGGRVVHTFPSSLLEAASKVDIRFFSLPIFVDSQNMLLHSVTFSGYKFK